MVEGLVGMRGKVAGQKLFLESSRGSSQAARPLPPAFLTFLLNVTLSFLLPRFLSGSLWETVVSQHQGAAALRPVPGMPSPLFIRMFSISVLGFAMMRG